MRVALALLHALVAVCLACGGEARPAIVEGVPFAVEIHAFAPGAGAGFGQDRMPDVVLGPPSGGRSASGSTDVLSLGGGGAIVLRLGRPIIDGDGADLIVFENPFLFGGTQIFAEPGEVAVSADGVEFTTFPCAPADDAPNGCAGFMLVLAGEAIDVDATNPATAGGDAFDLADVGLAEAAFVRIVDVGTGGAAPTAGFDLDAVASVHP
jgi:hypothetical protein